MKLKFYDKKQQNYIRYVIEELIEDTFVDVRDQKIWHPYDSHYSRHLIGGAPGAFMDFVEDKFGILPGEVELVWSHYKHKIKDENGWVQIDPFDGRGESIRFAMSESRKHNKGNEDFKKIDNPKQHKFYNSIADKVVSLIEVRDSDIGGKIIYIERNDRLWGKHDNHLSENEMESLNNDLFDIKLDNNKSKQQLFSNIDKIIIDLIHKYDSVFTI